jgi:hypothetical protein
VRRWLGPAATGVLGANVWTALLLVPAIHTDAFSRAGPWIAAPLAIPLAVLAAGIALLALGRRRAPEALLYGFPVSLLVAPVFDPVLVGPGSHGGVTFALTLVSFLGYVAAVTWLLARAAEPTLSVRTTRLRHPEGDARIADRLRDRRLVLALAAGVPLFVLVLPFARPDGLSDLRRAFPDAPGAATAAVAALATTLAAGVLLVYFGPMLRRARAFPSGESASARTRLGWTLTMILAGAAAAVALAMR